MRSRYKQDRMHVYGPPTLLFLPFLAGRILFYFCSVPMNELSRVSCPILGALLVFSGACAYGILLTPLVLLLFGAVTSFWFSQLPSLFPSLIEKISAVRDLLPWYPALFCAAYLGLVSSKRLLSDRLGEKGRLKNCLMNSIRQLLLITGAAVLSRMIEML